MSAQSHLVISSLGSDRPGIVEALSRHVLDRGGNIVESRMAVLGGEFGAMLLVSGDDAALDRIEGELDSLEGEGLRALVTRTDAPHARATHGSLAYTLRATSLDHPGIVNRISQLLAKECVNIEAAECSAKPGPWSGAPVFHLEMTVALPDQKKALALRDKLTDLGRDEGIDIELHARG